MHRRILLELLHLSGNIVRTDPRLQPAADSRITLKASEPGGFFGSARRQAMFCDRLAGGSTPAGRIGAILPIAARTRHRSA